MAGLHVVAGIGPRVTLNGKEYQVRGKTNRFYADVKAEILHARGNPLNMIVEAGIKAKIANDPELLGKVADVVADKFRTQWGLVEYRDYLDYMASSEGDVLTAYHCLKQEDPTLTMDDVRDYIISTKFKGIGKDPENLAARKELEDLFEAIATASGESSGNSNGQTPTQVTTGT